ITVLDTVSPVAIANDTTIYLDATGNISITTAGIDNGSWDSCGIATMILDETDFDCSETGTNTVTLTVTDVNGNVKTATAIVTVLDNENPVALALDTTVYLDGSGNASITAQQIGYGSTDNCSIDSLHIDQSAFVCGEAGTAVPLVLTATDPSGNTDTAHFNVTVLDTTPPVASGQDLTVHLDING